MDRTLSSQLAAAYVDDRLRAANEARTARSAHSEAAEARSATPAAPRRRPLLSRLIPLR